MGRIGQAQLSFLNGLLFMLILGILAAEGVLTEAPSFVLPFLLAIGLGLAILSAVYVWRGNERAWLLAFLFFFVLGAARFLGASRLPAADISRFAGGAAQVTGVLREAPRIVPSPDGRGVRVRYLMDAERVTRDGTEARASGGLYVYASAQDENAVTARVGDRLTAEGRLLKLRGYKDPGVMDMERLSRLRGVTARLGAGKAGVRVSPVPSGGFMRRIEEARTHYKTAMREAMPEADAAAVFAILFGGYEGLRPELVEAFTTTGIVHILSVSGSHITLLASVMAWLCASLSLRRGIAACLVMFMIFGYVAMAGFVFPAVRAGLMGVLAFFALATGRESDARRLLSLVALVMLLVSPLSLFDISFELSFASTAGLLYIAPRVLEWQVLSALPRAVRDSLALTFGAQLAVLPICARYFHVVSLSAFLANLVVVPIVELILIVGLAAGILAFVLPFLGRLIFVADSLLLGLAYELTRFFAALPMSRVYLPAMNPAVTAIYYAALCIAFLRAETQAALFARTRPLGRFVPVFVSVCAVLLCVLALRANYRPAELAVHFIDVGQGDAALIVTPHGRAFMIDTGGMRDNSFDLGGRVDVPYLLHYGVTELDAVFLTHAHEDHAAGLAGILRRLSVGHVLTAGEGMPAYQASLGLSAKEMATTTFAAARAGMCFELDGVIVEVLFAPDAPNRADAGNEAGNVYRVRYGRASFLFTGDLLKEQEEIILKETGADTIRSSVLKVGHHGSRTSTGEAFLAAVAPRWAVISVGADNRFGHPNAETIAALDAAEIETYRTDRDGAVVFLTDGETMRVETYVPRK